MALLSKIVPSSVSNTGTCEKTYDIIDQGDTTNIYIIVSQPYDDN